MSQPNVLELAQTNEERIEALETFQRNLIDIVYPIGSIYMSMNDVSPAAFLGGTWERIQDRFLLSAGSSYAVGSTGGEATHTLSVAETPAHTHTRGTMEISGEIHSTHSLKYGWAGSGAFASTTAYNGASVAGNSGNTWSGQVNFYASRNWTGATSSVGGNTAHNNMPPYLTVYMWKRTS